MTREGKSSLGREGIKWAHLDLNHAEKKSSGEKKILEVADTMKESLLSTTKSRVPKSPTFHPSNPAKTGTVPVPNIGKPSARPYCAERQARQGEKEGGRRVRDLAGRKGGVVARSQRGEAGVAFGCGVAAS